MRKKIIVLVLVAVLLTCLFCSCDDVSKQEAYNLYQQMIKAMDSTEYTDMDLKMNLKTSIMGLNVESAITGNIKEVREDPTNPLMYLQFSLDAAGISLPIEIWYQNNECYIDSDGEKMKVSLPLEEVMRSFGLNSINVLEFSETAILDCRVQAVGKNKKIELSLDGAQVVGLIDQALEQAGLPSEIKLDVNITDISCFLMIDEECLLQSYTIIYSSLISVEEQTIKASVELELKVNSYNKVEFSLPSDLDSFIEMEY